MNVLPGLPGAVALSAAPIAADAALTIAPDLEGWMAPRAEATVTEVPGSSHAVFPSHPDVIGKAAGR